MADQEEPIFLEHFGIKGMKWGVRRKRQGNGRVDSSDFSNTKHLRNRRTRELSNREIQEINNRINLETNYNRLNPSRMARGRHAAMTVIAIGGTVNAAIALSRSPAGRAVASVLSKR